jgi:hypothetical protein
MSPLQSTGDKDESDIVFILVRIQFIWSLWVIIVINII